MNISVDKLKLIKKEQQVHITKYNPLMLHMLMIFPSLYIFRITT